MMALRICWMKTGFFLEADVLSLQRPSTNGPHGTKIGFAEVKGH